MPINKLNKDIIKLDKFNICISLVLTLNLNKGANQMNSREKELLEACKLARKYLARVVAEDLLNDCVIQPRRALLIIDGIIENDHRSSALLPK